MNEILQLKGQFSQKKNSNRPGAKNLPAGKSVNSDRISVLIKELQSILLYWKNQTFLPKALVEVHYNEITAKSNRICGVFALSGRTSNSSVVGARFDGDDISKNHVITHYVPLSFIEDAIENFAICRDIINNEFEGIITAEKLDSVNKSKYKIKDARIAKSKFAKYIVDSYHIKKFDVQTVVPEDYTGTIISLYDVELNVTSLLSKIGIDMFNAKHIDDTTVLLTPDDLDILKSKMPYLISMAVSDLAEYSSADFGEINDNITNDLIPDPNDEPVIGVIDTLFYDKVYFSKWVESEIWVDKSLGYESDDYFHGTSVTSIIVDGPTINPGLDDGCGRFRVRHFGVAKNGQFSSFTILKSIREIVAQNRDIKVWNLSLGADIEVKENSISPEAAELDKIQSEYDIIFVIAGTNKRDKSISRMRIGAPADSINGIVVNSVTSDKTPASYSREGVVLSFFNKPDICYYGGDLGEMMKVCCNTGEATVCGTSYAAPWISRKMAYLIHILGFSREVAKALLIDSAIGWRIIDDPHHIKGYGVVPQNIKDVVTTSDDEIKFVLSGVSEKYDTYTYNIPVPLVNDKHPFIAKATLCYFPKCSRNQGVDYTNTELDLHFGRLKADGKIDTINENKQGNEEKVYLKEKNARQYYRKWDNVKHINEIIKRQARPKQKYGTGLWGLSIKTKERLDVPYGNNLHFGVVVTLREMNGINRIEDFISQCQFRGWLVNRVNVETQIDVYQKAEETVEFE